MIAQTITPIVSDLTPFPANPDRSIVDAVLGGEVSAYNQIIDRYWDRIYQRVFQLLKNHEDAEEVTQDAFTRALANLATFRWEASLSTWLYQIASNLARNRFWYWKRRGRETNISMETPMGDDGLRVMDAISDLSDSPAEQLKWRELLDSITNAMPLLPTMHREVMEMRLVEDLSYEAISDRLSIPVGTVKSRLARAREHLMKSIKVEAGSKVQNLVQRHGEDMGLIKHA